MIKRESNIELLRLVCMFLIVFQHCIHLCAFPEIWDVSAMSTELCAASLLVGLTYIAVNCFVLISGYYGIKLKLRSALNIYLICTIYALCGYLLHLYIDGAHIGKGLLYSSIFCISHSKLWFVKCYVGLMLLSPLLNAAMDNMSKKTYLWVIGLLTVQNVYFGFVWQDEVFNANGYAIANFAYIYMIGGYIRRYVNIEWCYRHRVENIGVYLITSLLWAGSIILQRYVPMPYEEWLWGYNNPFTLLGAISFFMLFLSIPNFYKKTINWLAAGTFAVYLVHCDGYMGEYIISYIRTVANYIHTEYGVVLTVVGMLLMSIVMLLSICVIDKIRSAITQPIVDNVCALFAHTQGANKS